MLDDAVPKKDRCWHTSKELPSTAILHTKVQMLIGLERVIEGDDEGMITRSENLLFC